MAELPVPVTDPEDVRQVTESVLSRPEFLESRPTWWQELQQAIGDLLGRFIELVGGGGRGSVIGTVVLVILALAAALVILRFSRTVRRDPSAAMAVDGQIGRTPQDWLDDARHHEQARRWRDAVRCRYRALLAELAAAGLVEEVPGRTSGEYLSDVGRDVPSAAEPFAGATRRFEAAWYGDATLNEQDIRDFVDVAADVVRRVGVRAPVSVGR